MTVATVSKMKAPATPVRAFSAAAFSAAAVAASVLASIAASAASAFLPATRFHHSMKYSEKRERDTRRTSHIG